MFFGPDGTFVRLLSRALPVAVSLALVAALAYWAVSADGSHHGGLSVTRGRPPSSSGPTLHPSVCFSTGCPGTGPYMSMAQAKTHLLTYAELHTNADIRWANSDARSNWAPPKTNDLYPACDWSWRHLLSDNQFGHTTYRQIYDSWWWQYPQWADTPKSHPPRYRYIESLTVYDDYRQEFGDFEAIKDQICERPATTETRILDGWSMLRRYQTVHCINIHWDDGYCSLYDDYFIRDNIILAVEWSEAPDDHHHAQHTADRLDTLILAKMNQGLTAS